MSDFDDLDGVTQPHIPDETAEQLLRGIWSGDGASQNLADVAALFSAARSSAETEELASMDATLSAFRLTVGAHAAPPPTPRKRLMQKKLLTAKVAAAIGVATLATAGVAAASGSLPNPFSSSAPAVVTTDDTIVDDTAVDDTIVDDTAVDGTEVEDTEVEATEVGATEVTTPETDDTAVDESTPDSEDAGQGPDATGPAKFGLCTAYAARTKHDQATDSSTPTASSIADGSEDGALPIPFQNLEDAATAAGQSVEEFCADATPGGQSADNPSASAPGHADDNPSATAPGHSDDNPSATAPGHDGGDDNTPTTVTDAGQSGSHPSDTAPGRSGDHGQSTGSGKGNGKG